MTRDSRVALVTGASRGIGAATAVKLAEQGFDVAIGARTLGGDDPELVDDLSEIGSLGQTAALVEARDRRALPVEMDLTDRDSVRSFVERATTELGDVDVLVNNAVYQGPGNMAPLEGTDLELIERTVDADVISMALLLQLIVPSMAARGGGVVVNVTSAVAFREPPGPLGRGGWGFAYGIAKGACDRMAGLVNAEFGDRGVRAYNIEPGFVAYGERLESAKASYPGIAVTPPAAIGATIAWLATDDGASRFLNKRVHGPELCRDLELLPGWPPPEPE